MAVNQRADPARLQVVRLRRSLMGLGSYACTMALVLVCYFAGLVPGWVTAVYIAMVLATNAIFIALIKTDLNLSFARPDMTMEQVVCSVLPGLVTIYFIELPMARSAFLLLALVPLIFGTLGLKTLRALSAGLVIFAAYVVVLCLIALFAPQRIERTGDLITLVAFFGAVLQIALIGGYIGGLRSALSDRNRELRQALGTIESLANKDELTGAWNRRYLMRTLELELSRPEAELTVIIMDIDHFKAINDNHGHPVGDQVLVLVAQSIQACIRRTDHFGRFGGEEFLLVMPGASLTSSEAKAEQIRARVEATDFSGAGYPHSVTLSFGIACRIQGESHEATIKRADKALYLAKAEGRNCVRCAAGM